MHPHLFRIRTLEVCIAIKFLTKSSWVGTHNFQRQESAISPFARHSNKATLFCFTQNSVSKIQFATSAQMPSFQHHLHIPKLTPLFHASTQAIPSAQGILLTRLSVHLSDLGSNIASCRNLF